VIAGEDLTGDIASIERASILGDGSLSSFSTYSVSFPIALSTGSVAYDSISSSVYFSGGTSRAIGTLSGVYRSSASHGDLSAFTAVSYLENPRYLHRSIILGRALIIVGGTDLPLEKAMINHDGTLTTFHNEVSLLNVRQGLSIGYSDGALYCVGGIGSTPHPFKSVEVVRIAADGTFHSNSLLLSNVTLRTGRFGQEGGVFGGELTVIGGESTIGTDTLSSIEVALITNA